MAAALITLSMPELMDIDDPEVRSWESLVADKAGMQTGAMEIGDTYAMYDRNSFAEDWSVDSNRVFVTRVDNDFVVINDADGRLIDDPANFVSGGLQAYAPDMGDN